MKAVFKVIGGVMVLAVAGVISVPLFIPTEAVIEKVSHQVESTTGRQLSIVGESQLSLFPSLHVTLNEVSLSNMATGSVENMLTMEQLSVHIPWLSLLSGEAQLERFVIKNPNVMLEVDNNGNANWQLLPTQTHDTSQSISKPAENNASTTLPSGFDVSLGEVAVYGGRVTYYDARTQVTHRLDELEINVQLPSLYEAFMVNGAVTYQSQQFTLTSIVETPAKVITGDTFNIEQVLESQLFEFKFNGEISDRGQQVNGELTLAGDSLKEIMAWQQVTLDAKSNAFNQFSLAGRLSLDNNVFSLASLVAKLDALEIKGESQITLASMPSIQAKIDLGVLDLNPYLPDVVEPSESDSEKLPGQTPAQPIKWDDTAIDLTVLNQFNADMTVRSTALRARDITLGDNQLTLRINNGRTDISLDKFNAYRGQGNGHISVHTYETPYKVESAFELESIDAEPLLTDAIGFDKVLGKGSVNWDLASEGQTQKQFIGALAGKLAFNFQDGGIKGANIAEMTRKAKEMLKGDFSSLKDGLNAAYDPAKTTDFSALTGSFIFKEGVGRNDDLSLASPLIRISGLGDVDLPNTLVNYRLVTGIVDSIEGQASTDKSTGFKVPLRIKGPFHNIDVNIDISKAAKDKAKEKLKDKIKDKFKGLFGG